ncbi:MAG: ATP-binding protein [Vicinamibacterales bacterium]
MALESNAGLSRVQEELAEWYRRFVDIQDFVPVPYLMLTKSLVVSAVNQAGLALLGSDRARLIGRPLLAFVARKDLRALFDAAFSATTTSAATAEVLLNTAKGPRPVQVILRPSGEPEKHTAFYHAAIVDLTEVRRLEAERVQSQAAERAARAASEAKDQFIARLSHELRTPLTPVLAAADSIRLDGAPPGLREAVEVIRRNVLAEARLIDDLLDVARAAQERLPLDMATVDLHKVLADVADDVRLARRSRADAFEVRMAASRASVRGDPARIAQVFRNLIDNAFKFSEPDGSVSVVTEDAGRFVRVSFTDTGIGMSRKQLQQLFKPFVQVSDAVESQGGLGLGLVISKGLIEAHGGTIEAHSEGPGRGTTISVCLPSVEAAKEVPGRRAGRPAPSAAGQGGATVLLVEDHPDSARMLSLLLSTEGFKVRVAGSLAQARSIADECDVIVSDISLPDGSGLDLVREVRARRPVHAVAVSGYGSIHDVEKSREAGFAEHLTKPVDLERLLAAVRRLSSVKC